MSTETATRTGPVIPTGAWSVDPSHSTVGFSVSTWVRLDVLIQGTDIDPWGNTRAGLEVQGTLKRSDFDSSSRIRPGGFS